MKPLINCLEEVHTTNTNDNKEYFVVFIYSKSKPSKYCFVTLDSMEALQNLKSFHSKNDSIFIELKRV